METPPRARGRPVGAGPLAGWSGNTPACAGKTTREQKLAGFTRKHPRVRGEDRLASFSSTAPTETPPRARGRRPACRGRERRPGNTPACAGKTSHRPANHGGRGNTPACAGKTPGQGFSHPFLWKHPRVRGEDLIASPGRSYPSETPPRARGRPGCDVRSDPRSGNTPACAGKTGPGGRITTHERKHPRVRGEDLTASPRTPHTWETPPRARGRPPSGSVKSSGNGNTPACAGKTLIDLRFYPSGHELEPIETHHAAHAPVVD